MRLNLYEKNKNIWLYSFIAVMLPIIILHVVRLNVHAENISTLPFSYGIGSGFGYDNSVGFSDRQIFTGINNLVESITTENYTPKTVLFYEKDLTNMTLTVAVADFEVAYWGRVTKQGVVSSAYVDSYIRDASNGSATPSFRLYRLSSDGSFVFLNDRSVNTAGFPAQGEGFVSSNTDYFMYPLWTYNHYDINMYYNSNFSQYQFTGLVFSGIGGFDPVEGFDAPGFGSGSYEVDPDTGDISGFSFDFNLDLSSIGDTLTTLFNNLSESLGSWFDPIHDKLDIIIGKLNDILDNMGAILDRMSPNNLTTQNFGDATGYLLNNFVKNSPAFKQWVDLGTSFKDFYEELFDDSDFENPVYDDGFPVVEYESYWIMPTNDEMDEHPEFDGWYVPISFKADFRWYERIREPFLRVFMTFFTIGFLFYAIKQVPNILHGVAGGVSNGSSVAEGIHEIATLHPKKKGGD